MSEHTKGRLEAFTQESFSGWYALRDQDHFEVGSGDGGFDEADARRLAACWNAFTDPAHTTEMIEKLCEHRVLGKGGVSSLANKNISLEKELAAARALLREVSDLGLYIEPNGRMSNECEELTSKIYDYLDACNTPEGAPNAG